MKRHMIPQTAPEKTALFNPFNGHLEQLFGYIDIGDLGLPDIQRPFVWKDAKVRDLFDSIYRGFPIGSYLFWRNTVGGKAHQIGMSKKEHEDPVLLIIDGQQRLTAMYAVFRNQPVKDENYENRRIVIAFNPVTEEFKVADASTERNPEYINSISDFLAGSGTRKFINGYLERLQKYYAQLNKRHAAILQKLDNDEDLTQQDIELITTVIKGQTSISDEEKTILEKLDEPIEKNAEENEDSAVEEDENGNDESTASSFLNRSEKRLLTRMLAEEEAFDEDQISQRLEKLYNLKNYPFNALEVVPNLTEEQVADIFTRINSKGTVLKQADFILTLLSVFWEKGREQIDDFCKLSKKVPEKNAAASPFNYILEPTPKDLIRISVGLGFNRGEMKDAYSILSGRDFTTKKVSAKLREDQFKSFKEAQERALDLSNWHEFLKIILGLGYKSAELISSSNNIANAYILYLIAKIKVGLNRKELERCIGKWFFFSSLTSRYSFSPESQMESDLATFRMKTPAGFIKSLNAIIDSEITNDFWEITVPNKLLVSSSKHNPLRNAFFACLIRKGALVLFSPRKVADLFDPALRQKRKSLEKHHLFPKAYLRDEFGMDKRQINQVANFTYLEYPDNAEISDDAPKKYFEEIRKSQFQNNPELLSTMMVDHCLPEKFYALEYDDFLQARRKLMARMVRDTFKSL
jgi:hypothetical protein